MAVQFVQPHQFTPEQFCRMTRDGLIPRQGMELIEGVVVSGTRPLQFSNAGYLRLAEEGILHEDDRVELIDGEIVRMSPVGGRHSECVARLVKLLVGCAGDKDTRIQDPLVLADGQQPQPDAFVARPRPATYDASLRSAADALLVIEVADSSLLFDRTIKAQHYADAGIPEYWLVDLKRDVVLVMQEPAASAYLDAREYRHGESWTSPALDGAEIEAASVLGPPRT